jgi:hypothetical protein
MKKVLLLLCALSFCSAIAQTKEKELSNAEKFSAKAGVLIQKTFLEVGTLKAAVFSVVQYTDLMSNTKATALKIEYESTAKYSGTKIAMLDADEITGLIMSIKLIQDKIFPSAPTSYTEVSFKSRGGFEAGCFWSKSKWDTYLKLEKYDKDSYVFLEKEDFPPLLTILEQAKAKMQ